MKIMMMKKLKMVGLLQGNLNQILLAVFSQIKKTKLL
jgi:hypothetical protein